MLVKAWNNMHASIIINCWKKVDICGYQLNIITHYEDNDVNLCTNLLTDMANEINKTMENINKTTNDFNDDYNVIDYINFETETNLNEWTEKFKETSDKSN